MRKRERMLAVYKHNTGVSLFFPVAAKGWLKGKVEEKLERDIVFVSNSIETHYDCRIKTLTGEQARSMIKTLNQMKAKSKIEFSRELVTKFNLTDQMYNILLRNEIKDACFIIRTEKRRKDAKQVNLDLLLLAEDKKTESFILNASGLGKKKRKIIPTNKSFNKLMFSSVRSKHSVEIDEIATLVHVPHTYRGGSLPARSKDITSELSNFVQDKDSIIVGRAVDEEDIGSEIALNVKDLLLNVEIFGQIGRGKTKTVSSIVGQLFDKKISTLVFDIKGEYAKIFSDNPNVEIFTIGRPRPLCINLFETIDEDDIHNTLLIIEEMLVSSNQEFTPAMKNLFETALFLTHKSPKRNLQVFVENIFKVSKQLQAHSNITYLQQTIDAVLNRLNFIFNPINFEILGATRTTLDLSLLEGGKSIILDLSQFQKRAARPSDIFLVCNLILKMLYRHASSKEMTNQLRYMVILEEAINIIPNFYHSESSASLITAENNFLLGRSLGIG
ncbi:MAG: ATP-binding protein, partial [Candidatus Heimdallarchaeaceae archaeon]